MFHNDYLLFQYPQQSQPQKQTVGLTPRKPMKKPLSKLYHWRYLCWLDRPAKPVREM
jgi:hypothetical protein